MNIRKIQKRIDYLVGTYGPMTVCAGRAADEQGRAASDFYYRVHSPLVGEELQRASLTKTQYPDVSGR